MVRSSLISFGGILDEKGTSTTIARVEGKILLIRGSKVIVDADLAGLYGVTTKRLNEQVRRNFARFPDDFMFQLTADEKREVVTNCDHLSNLKFSPTLPFAFTEHGAIMAASVLNSDRAIEISVFVVRAFVQLRGAIQSHAALARTVAELELRLSSHDRAIISLIDAIKQLMQPGEPKNPRRIGFHSQ